MAINIRKKHKPHTGKSDLERLLDLYWGGSERRITKLTLRIISVNLITLLVLMLGVLYLSQYQTDLIATKLESFTKETKLIAATLPTQTTPETLQNLANLSGHEIMLFSTQSQKTLSARPTVPPPKNHEWVSLKVLRNMARFVTGIFPDQNLLPLLTKNIINDIRNAQQNGSTTIAVWRKNQQSQELILTAATPIKENDKIIGALLITRNGADINKAIGDVWITILQIFFATLLITILLSIYLSGVITRPLRLLTKSAERVRMHPTQNHTIPDLSARHDEIGELSLVLRDMTQSLWARMDSIDRFAADVAHELKNPLTSLKSAVETLRSAKKAKDKAQLTEIIEHDITRMDRLITDIAHVSRLDTELSRTPLKPIAIRPLLDRIVARYHTIDKDTSIRIIDHTPPNTKIRGWDDRLVQVFENILGNARSFSGAGDEIVIRLDKEKGNLLIRIEDQGTGIPEGKLETIFDRFYTERPAHEDYGEHSGLGLYICREIMRALGGDIYAENIRNVRGEIIGARFVIAIVVAG